MPVIPLTGTRRDDIGKGGARKARAAGRIPGVLYGHGEEPIALSVSAREFELAVRKQGGNPIMGLGLDGGEHTALIRAVQYDPISHDIIHLDFLRISLTETIEVEVPIRLVGTPVGVKDGGGILEPILRELKVRCLPTAIPPFVEVDVTALNIGDSVHVSAISAPEVTIVTDADVTVATVVPPTVQVEEKPAEEAAAAAATAAGADAGRARGHRQGQEGRGRGRRGQGRQGRQGRQGGKPARKARAARRSSGPWRWCSVSAIRVRATRAPGTTWGGACWSGWSGAGAPRRPGSTTPGGPGAPSGRAGSWTCSSRSPT